MDVSTERYGGFVISAPKGSRYPEPFLPLTNGLSGFYTSNFP